VLAVVILLATGAGWYQWHAFDRTAAYETRLVLQGDIDVRQVNLAFKVDGRIAELNVDEGDSVHAGQVVATLDKVYFDDDLRLARARRDNAKSNLERLQNGSRPEEISEARALLAQQQANLTLAKANLKRAEELEPIGGISKEEVDVRRQAIAVGAANVKYAEEALRLAVIGPRHEDIDVGRAQFHQEEAAVIQSERRRIDHELIAPNDGVILTRAREKGAIVAAGETVFTLTLASPVWDRTYVNERDLGRIRPDLPAEVRTDSAPGKVYRGFIGFISPTAEFTPKIVETRELRTDLVYRLRVIVENPDGGLRQGMPVTASLVLPEPRPRTFWERFLEALPWSRFAEEPTHGR
jgi:HlyD family secretion protein